MRKKEFINIHALLTEVTQYLIEDEAMPAEMLSAYAALDTRPTSIYKSKQDHREAIIVLISAIEPCLKQTQTDSQKQSVNQ
jgi:hypothetical protein